MTAPKKIVPDESGLFWEMRAADALGVSRKLLARLRAAHLREPDDFVRRANNAVALTAAGLARIEDLLANGADAGAGQTKGKTTEPSAPAGPPKREKMTVERIAQNPGLLLCKAEGRAVLVAVRVRDNLNFIAGMMFEAVQSQDGVWQFRNRLAGNGGNDSTVGRLPRRKGVW